MLMRTKKQGSDILNSPIHSVSSNLRLLLLKEYRNLHKLFYETEMSVFCFAMN